MFTKNLKIHFSLEIISMAINLEITLVTLENIYDIILGNKESSQIVLEKCNFNLKLKINHSNIIIMEVALLVILEVNKINGITINEVYDS